MQRRSNVRGLVRVAGHLGVIAATGWIYGVAISGARAGSTAWALAIAPAAVAFGFTLVTMFAAMHESVHRTAFRTRWLNDGVAWFAGLLSFYNSTFYRPYHGWHHRFTQVRGRDPELEDPKPTSVGTYLVELSGITWWVGKLRTHLALARGRVAAYGFLDGRTGPAAVRSVRLQLGVYGAALVASVALGWPYFIVYWLAPVAVAQPLLRMILLAEHTGCSNDDDALANTRTTHTILPVRFLMWEMPYHAEHHRYPALPFFVLRPAHAVLGPHLAHVARRGYLGFHAALLRGLMAPDRPPAGPAA